MILKLAWRNLWRNKKRSIITISSITIAIFLTVFMRSMQLGMYDNMIKNVVGSYSGYVQVHAKGFWEEQNLDNSLVLNDALINKTKNVMGVNNVIPRLQTFSLGADDEISKGVFIQGIEIDKEKLLVDWNNRLVKGTLFSNESKDIILAKGVAKYFKKSVGDTLVFIGQGYHGMSATGKYKICGIVDMKNPKINDVNVFMSLKNTQEYLSAPNRITNLVIDKSKETSTEITLHNLQKTLDKKQFEVMSWKTMLPELEQTILADSIGGIIMVFILYMIITFGIFGTVLMMTQERIYELGVMVSIGMKKLKLIKMLVVETLFLTLIGIISGTLLVAPFIFYFHQNPINLAGDQAAVMEKFGFESTVPLLTNFSIPFTHGLIIFCISFVITIYPTIIILKLNPVKAMKR